MKQRLLKLMVVASCLSFLFSWQLTAGAIESGRIPDWGVNVAHTDGIPEISELTRPTITSDKDLLEGNLNTDIPFKLTFDAGDYAGKSVRLDFWIEKSLKNGANFSGVEGLVNDINENGFVSAYLNIPNFQSGEYTFFVNTQDTVSAIINIELFEVDNDGYGYLLTSYSNIKLKAPKKYNQSDIDALKNIAASNPNSNDLKEFIEKGYYLEEFIPDSGRKIGVSWNNETSRVCYLYILDHERKIDTLNLSSLDGLESIDINYTNIRSLNLSAQSSLRSLGLYFTKMMWNDLTLSSDITSEVRLWGTTYISLDNQNGIEYVDDYNVKALNGTVIGLSDYAIFDGKESTFTWYKIINGGDRELVYMPEEPSPSRKYILSGEAGATYVCEISNPSRGEWFLLTPNIYINRNENAFSQEDIQGLKNLAANNSHIPQLQEFVDNQGWKNDNWDSRDIIRTRWSTGETARLTHLAIELPWEENPQSITNLDLSAFTELQWFSCERYMDISELDLSKNTKLETLHVYSRNLETIDVSMCPNLTDLKFITNVHEQADEYNYTKLSNLILTGCNNLKTLELEHAHLKSLDLTGFRNLYHLAINNCQELPLECLNGISSSLKELSLAQTTQFQNYIDNLPEQITFLDLDRTEYTLPAIERTRNLYALNLPNLKSSFDMDNYPNLKELGVGEYTSYIRYSQIDNYKDINFRGISLIEPKSSSKPEGAFEFISGDTIDLSSEAVINGKASEFKWKINNDVEDAKAFQPVEGKPGVFVINSNGGNYTCEIYNSLFAEKMDGYYRGWTMRAHILVEPPVSSDFHEGDVETLRRIVESSDNADLKEWWNKEMWKTGDNYKVAQAMWSYESPRRLTHLYLYNLLETIDTHVDLSPLDKLEQVSFTNSFVKKIDLPDNKSSLKALMLAGSWIQSLDVSSYTSLEYLDVSKTSLQTLDVSKNLALKELKLNGTLLEGVEKTAPEIAEQLTLYGVPSNTESIDLADFPKLVSLLPQMSNLRFSGVKNPRQMEEINMDNRMDLITYGSVRGSRTKYGEKLSFTDEMLIGEKSSTIRWESMNAITGDHTIIEALDSYIIGDDVNPGDCIITTLTNPMFPGWELKLATFAYTCDGDANLDKKVNVADVTATVSYILEDEENEIYPFGDFEADVNYDDIVDVADITGIVNIIQNRPVTKASELKDAYQPTVLLEVDDNGFLTMSSEVPVAGIQLEFTGAKEKLPLLGEAGRFAQGSTLNGDTLRMVAYSMDGKTLPSGKRVIMKMADGLKLTGASFSDADAASLKAEGDIVPTSTEAVKPQTQVEVVRNYPNPFSGSTTFSYSLSADAKKVSVEIFNATGAIVSVIEGMPAGAGLNKYTTTVQLPSGVYYYRLSIDGENGKTVSPANVMRIR